MVAGKWEVWVGPRVNVTVAVSGFTQHRDSGRCFLPKPLAVSAERADRGAGSGQSRRSQLTGAWSTRSLAPS